jgi:glycosyltransferase involved in cell wall biosynthesis
VFSGYKRDEDTVAKAWERIVENYLDQGYTLKFIGTKEIHQVPHSECIRRLPYRQYIEVLESSAFVILPLKEYKYSYGQMSLLGSLALGKYVITTNVSGISDYTVKCKSVLVVNPLDVQEMCHAISQFIKNQVISKDRGVPRRDVEKNFTERQMSKQIYKFIQKVLGLAL